MSHPHDELVVGGRYRISRAHEWDISFANCPKDRKSHYKLIKLLKQLLKISMQGLFVTNSQQLFNTLSSNVSTMGLLLGALIMDFMSTVMENILK